MSMARLSRKRPIISDDEYCQMIRAYPPSAFLSELCGVSSELMAGEWELRDGPYLVTPWALADMARVSIAQSNAFRHRVPTRRDILRCANVYHQLDDPDLMRNDPDAVERFFLRTASQQLDFQHGPIHEIARSALLCSMQTTKPFEVMVDGWDRELLGCSLDEYLAVGELILYGHHPNRGQFSATFFNHPGLHGLFGELTPAQLGQIYIRNFVQDVEQFKRSVRPNDRPAPYRRMTYNPLIAAPAITGLDSLDYVPVANLVVRKISPLGLYYAGLAHFGEAFARDMGQLFEAYVGANLQLCSDAVVHPEVTYGKSTQKSVDWFVVTPSAVVLVEAKSVRPTEEVRVGGPDAAAALQRMLKKAGNQIQRTSEEIDRGNPSFAHIPRDRPRAGLVATIADFHVLNADPIRKFAGLQTALPTVIGSIGEIEMVVNNVPDFAKFVHTVATAHPATGNSMRAALKSNDPSHDNPILIRAWESGLLHANLRAVLESRGESVTS